MFKIMRGLIAKPPRSPYLNPM